MVAHWARYFDSMAFRARRLYSLLLPGVPWVKPEGDVLAFKQRGDEAAKPFQLWSPTCIGEYESLSMSRIYRDIALMRNGHSYSWQLLKLHPS